ncbi:peptidoglycan-binding domain-containing protein [Rhizobium leucaenae]|uniref:Peptidoglycan hydrolase-like protein with peptidoglycan-binding domain n=1 Tax=Rhizobium leucaenae TaxID=29450 RepID=A0A7W6ZT62_9HYPH|nr:peptidoglycan-binding domain-containing protein [Rhizobium leucaenae]MBB4568298.1 peptidoglycan hydrolase-like protein with peptidoglycan-binding domain [Rhizobium leucaenae]MBB6300543.1 peptidoglycan hydrolase-like protein with peptidoglycan-binding domain [Rhizobium leucaenae]
MAPQKRKSPKGKGRARRKQPGLVSQGAVAVGSLGLRGAGALGGLSVRGVGALATLSGGVVGRHPAVAAGVAIFFAVFGFVTANALWYQSGAHPSPLLRTRDPNSPYQIPGRKAFLRAQQADMGNVTTFRIERQDAASANAAVPAQTASLPATQTPAAAAMAPSKLVADVQAELIRRGLYDGAADGVIGSRTTAAILFFQEASGLAQTGVASPELLTALKANDPGTHAASKTTVAAVPAERPINVSAKASAVDPVAAAIQSAEKDIRTNAAPRSAPSDAVNTINMVMQIQKGLSNIAYSNVSIDGVAGEQTKAAIRRFQKHYRLPETGEPDLAVLKKLQDIGAL